MYLLRASQCAYRPCTFLPSAFSSSVPSSCNRSSKEKPSSISTRQIRCSSAQKASIEPMSVLSSGMVAVFQGCVSITSQVKDGLERVARIPIIHLHGRCLHHHPQQSSRGRSPEETPGREFLQTKAAKHIHNPPCSHDETKKPGSQGRRGRRSLTSLTAVLSRNQLLNNKQNRDDTTAAEGGPLCRM
jgi:hypothetical protein